MATKTPVCSFFKVIFLKQFPGRVRNCRRSQLAQFLAYRHKIWYSDSVINEAQKGVRKIESSLLLYCYFHYYFHFRYLLLLLLIVILFLLF